ncbi:hypothetical protein AB3M83_01745 [Microbacterium sp. 179-B 1A2 NHS]|uniref:hypothetical protein n=1 Tax=Microbacterium sp. 179-B 1A2 NHS TaxID=3142383 RepID=UPI0039A326E8
MAKTNTEISSELERALTEQCPIRLYRRREREFDRIWAFVIGLSREWVALQ